MEINKIKISFGKPRFKVNPYAGTVTCTLPWQFKNDELKMVLSAIGGVDGWSEKEVTSIATVSENDTFDALKGKKIAQAKCEIKAYTKAVDMINKFTENVANVTALTEEFIKKATDTIEHDTVFVADVPTEDEGTDGTETTTVAV